MSEMFEMARAVTDVQAAAFIAGRRSASLEWVGLVLEILSALKDGDVARLDKAATRARVMAEQIGKENSTGK